MSINWESTKWRERLQALARETPPHTLDALSFTYEGVAFHVHGVLHGISGGLNAEYRHGVDRAERRGLPRRNRGAVGTAVRRCGRAGTTAGGRVGGRELAHRRAVRGLLWNVAGRGGLRLGRAIGAGFVGGHDVDPGVARVVRDITGEQWTENSDRGRKRHMEMTCVQLDEFEL